MKITIEGFGAFLICAAIVINMIGLLVRFSVGMKEVIGKLLNLYSDRKLDKYYKKFYKN